MQREVLENAWFRKVSGRFPEGFPEEIANSRKRMVPEGFRKVPGRFPGRAKTHKAPPPPKASPEIPEDFRKVSGRFPEEQPPAATPRSTGVGNLKKHATPACQQMSQQRNSKKTALPEGFRKIPGRFPGRGNFNNACAQGFGKPSYIYIHIYI